MFRRKRVASAPSTDVIPNFLTLADAAAGIFTLGGPGSGKTSTIMSMIAFNLIRLGCGILWLIVKPGDFENQVLPIVRAAGAMHRLKRFAPGSGESCDLITTELKSPGGSVASAAALLKTVSQANSRHQGGGGGGEDGNFWEEACETTIYNAITILYKVLGRCSLLDLRLFLDSAPLSTELTEGKTEQAAQWRETSFCWRVIVQGTALFGNDRDYIAATRYFAEKWPALSDRTRSVIDMTIINLTQRLSSGDLTSLIASPETTVTPEFILNGGILPIDMPVNTYRAQGVLTAVAWKCMLQHAALRRKGTRDELPVCILADEYQWLITPSEDMAAQTVAREAKLISCPAAQNLPMLYSTCGGRDAHDRIDGFLSCHMTILALSNPCIKTATYLSKLYGSDWEDVWSDQQGGNDDFDPAGELMGKRQRSGVSMSRTPHWRPVVQVEEFGRLHKPSYAEPWAEAFLYQSGRTYAETGRPWVKLAFPRFL